MKKKWFKINKTDKIFYSQSLAKTAKEAFERSIEGWTLMSKGYSSFNAVRCCGLCNVYMEKIKGKDCEKCPIKLFTGLPYCENTSYQNYHEISTDDNRKFAVKAEIKFLKMLAKKTLKERKIKI